MIVDLFAGGGGASLGLEQALGRAVDVAVNHDPEAIRVHALNHPRTKHFQDDVFWIDPIWATEGHPVDVLWASPDCTHHSRAKGGKPVEHGRRSLAWVVLRWAAAVKPRVIMLENVMEFEGWGPLDRTGRPCKKRKGRTFEQWVGHLRNLGYVVEWRRLVAADYGAPTTRTRLFLVARRDGEPIVWPAPTHGEGRAHPWRTAAECIDWSIPCPSIFTRKRPLKENTLKRIARGMFRYVIDDPDPFIVTVGYGERSGQAPRCNGLDEPLGTVVAGGVKHGLVTPYLVGIDNKSSPSVWDAETPLTTITTEARHCVVAPVLVNQANTGTTGRGPNCWTVEEPLRTITTRPSHALVSAFIAKHYGGVTGHRVDRPLGTVTSVDHHSLVQAFLVKYYGCGVGQSLREPLHTITTKDRLGLVTVQGEDYRIVDIGLRMLQPHELQLAQGFPAEYVIDGTKSTQVRLIGNSVPPPWAKALAEANCGFAMARGRGRSRRAAG